MKDIYRLNQSENLILFKVRNQGSIKNLFEKLRNSSDADINDINIFNPEKNFYSVEEIERILSKSRIVPLKRNLILINNFDLVKENHQDKFLKEFEDNKISTFIIIVENISKVKKSILSRCSRIIDKEIEINLESSEDGKYLVKKFFNFNEDILEKLSEDLFIEVNKFILNLNSEEVNFFPEILEISKKLQNDLDITDKDLTKFLRLNIEDKLVRRLSKGEFQIYLETQENLKLLEECEVFNTMGNLTLNYALLLNLKINKNI